MTRAYIRVDPFLPEHKADAQQGEDYPDGAGWTFVLTLCWAGRQSPPGYFANRRVLAALLGRRARWIDYLLDHGDLTKLPDGRLYAEGWKEWQEGQYPSIQARTDAIANREKPAKTPAERARDYRRRKREEAEAQQASGVTESVTPNETVTSSRNGVTASDSPSVGVGPSVSDTHAHRDVTVVMPPGFDEAPEGPAVAWLARHGCHITSPADKRLHELVTLVEQFGSDAVISTFERLAAAGMPNGDTGPYIFRAGDALRAPHRPRLDKPESAADDEDAQRRRQETAERTAKLIEERQAVKVPSEEERRAGMAQLAAAVGKPNRGG